MLAQRIRYEMYNHNTFRLLHIRTSHSWFDVGCVAPEYWLADSQASRGSWSRRKFKLPTKNIQTTQSNYKRILIRGQCWDQLMIRPRATRNRMIFTTSVFEQETPHTTLYLSKVQILQLPLWCAPRRHVIVETRHFSDDNRTCEWLPRCMHITPPD